MFNDALDRLRTLLPRSIFTSPIPLIELDPQSTSSPHNDEAHDGDPRTANGSLEVRSQVYSDEMKTANGGLEVRFDVPGTVYDKPNEDIKYTTTPDDCNIDITKMDESRTPHIVASSETAEGASVQEPLIP